MKGHAVVTYETTWGKNIPPTQQTIGAGRVICNTFQFTGSGYIVGLRWCANKGETLDALGIIRAAIPTSHAFIAVAHFSIPNNVASAPAWQHKYLGKRLRVNAPTDYRIEVYITSGAYFVDTTGLTGISITTQNITVPADGSPYAQGINGVNQFIDPNVTVHGYRYGVDVLYLPDNPPHT